MKKKTTNVHPFVAMAGLNSEDEFYAKYKTEDDFFREFPKARYGFTSDETPDLNKVYEQDNVMDWVDIRNNNQNAQPLTNSSTAASGVTPTGSSFDYQGAISSAAGVATDIIGGIGSMWRDVQIVAPKLLSSLIPDNHNERISGPRVATNQYAYGTGSQMMYEDGGMLPTAQRNDYEEGGEYEVTAEELRRLKQLGYQIDILK